MVRTRRRPFRARAAVQVGAALCCVLAAPARPLGAQGSDAGSRRARVTGSATLTTKGISTIPSFTLGKPAAILDLAIRKGPVGFEPQFRYGLDGRPWSFLFWGRWRPVEGERFRLSVGAHPALSFRSVRDPTGGAAERIEARRYLAGEVSPTLALSRNVSVGPYYLYSYGVERTVARNTHFLALRAQLAGRAPDERYELRLSPQVYYLRVAERDGYYLNAGATLSRRDLPVTLSSLVNQPIRSRVPGGGGFLWNLSASYVFR